MSSVYDLHLRSTSLSHPDPEHAVPEESGGTRHGESSGERKLRLATTALRDRCAGPNG
jgi:hypothetical protein